QRDRQHHHHRGVDLHVVAGTERRRLPEPPGQPAVHPVQRLAGQGDPTDRPSLVGFRPADDGSHHQGGEDRGPDEPGTGDPVGPAGPPAGEVHRRNRRGSVGKPATPRERSIWYARRRGHTRYGKAASPSPARAAVMPSRRNSSTNNPCSWSTTSGCSACSGERSSGSVSRSNSSDWPPLATKMIITLSGSYIRWWGRGGANGGCGPMKETCPWNGTSASPPGMLRATRGTSSCSTARSAAQRSTVSSAGSGLICGM